MATMQQVPTLLDRALRCRHNIMLLSPPAYGKTHTVSAWSRQKIDENPDFFFVVLDGGTLAPTDLSMAMPDMSEGIIKVLRDGRLPNAYHTPKLVGAIYVGEWMLAGLEVNRGLQKLVNHEDLGGFRIPEGVIFIADGNRAQDKSGVQTQSRAIMSRFKQFEISYDTDHALDVVKDNYHQRVAAFLIRNPQCIDNYIDVFENNERNANDLTLQEGKRGIWANLRSWQRVSDDMHDADASGVPLLPGEIQANLGNGIAAHFETFCQMLDKLTTLEEIVAAPDKVKIPTKMDEKYALSTMLALLVNKDNFEAVAKYMNRYDDELQVVYFTVMNDRLRRNNDANRSAIRSSSTYKKWITAAHISKAIQNASAV